MSGETVRGAVSPSAVSTTYDPAVRRQAQRHGRERGCRVNIPAVELEKAGIDTNGPPPWYRTSGYRRSRNGHTIIVSLYQEQ